MRVALIVEWLDTWRGGAETSTQQFIHHLVDLGVEVEVYSRSRMATRPGLHVHSLAGAGLSRAVQSRTFRRRADRAAAASNCDLIHALIPSTVADVYQPRGGAYAETLARNVALRNTTGGRWLKRASQALNIRQGMLLAEERRMLRGPRPPVVLALSDYVAEQMVRHYGLARERIVKVFNGVDTGPLEPAARLRERHAVRKLYDVADGHLLVLVVAHNFRLKGLGTWLQAMGDLRRSGLTHIRCLVAGRDRSWSWRKLAAQQGIGEQVQFIGATPRVGALYAAADVLVHSTFYDPCSRVVLEALASGLPCVTTRFDGAAEAVSDGVSGFVLDDPADSAALAERVWRLCDPSLRARMAQAAAAAGANLTMRRHAEGVVRVYETLNGAARRA